ncbi:MAG: FtsK/SpoIIIE domain-containing protein, partial [Bryobacteraceae bacterium]
MTPVSVTPVPLSVAEVRAEIARVSGKGEGEPSTALLGDLFHEVCAGLLDPSSPRGWHTLLGENELGDVDILVEAAYTAFAGPRLSRFQAALQNRPEQVLHFWTATLELCRWASGVIGAARQQGWLAYDQALDRWTGGERLVSVEQELSCDFVEPLWKQRVRLSGVADAILRKPSGEFCVIEYKLGRGAPEADLAQAALYYELLCGGSDNGALALVRFLPELEETVYRGDSLRAARKALRQLAGRLAGVLPGQTPAEPAPMPAPEPSPESSELHRQLGRDLEAALRDHGAPGRVAEAPIAGPAFLRFTVEPERGVAVGRALRLPLDLQVRLKLARPPFIHVDKGSLVIDVQRPDRQQVTFSQIEAQLPAADPVLGSSLIPIGVDLNGRLRYADLADPIHTHILVAGTTGSGKSEWLRTAVAGLLARNTPQTLRLTLIDPKRNAFLDLAESPFLEMPLVFPPEQPA